LAITSLVLYATFPNELYYIYTVEIIGKVYSNTLLVSLNNRIYLRDHQSPEHGDSASLPFHDATPITPLQFPLPEPQPRALMNRIFPRFFNSRPVDLNNGESGHTGTDSLPHPKECRLLPEDPEWAVGTSLSPFSQKDAVYIL